MSSAQPTRGRRLETAPVLPLSGKKKKRQLCIFCCYTSVCNWVKPQIFGCEEMLLFITACRTPMSGFCPLWVVVRRCSDFLFSFNFPLILHHGRWKHSNESETLLSSFWDNKSLDISPHYIIQIFTFYALHATMIDVKEYFPDAEIFIPSLISQLWCQCWQPLWLSLSESSKLPSRTPLYKWIWFDTKYTFFSQTMCGVKRLK